MPEPVRRAERPRRESATVYAEIEPDRKKEIYAELARLQDIGFRVLVIEEGGK